MKIRRPADSNTATNTNAHKHEGMEMPQGYFPQKGSTLGLTVCHCGRSVSDRSLYDIGGLRDGDRIYENAKLAGSSAVLLHVDQTARWQ